MAKLCYTESPFVETMTFRFGADTVTFDQSVHPPLVWDERQQEQLVGRAS